MYLLSLIVCFEGGGWYSRRIFLPVHAVAMGGAAWWLLDQSPAATLAAPVAFFAAALWVWCMYLHGELARRKPSPEHLTSFYLMMSLGGAVGAAAVAVGAPYLLRGTYELPIALVLCGFATLMLEYRRAWWSDIAWTAVAVGFSFRRRRYGARPRRTPSRSRATSTAACASSRPRTGASWCTVPYRMASNSPLTRADGKPPPTTHPAAV